MRVAIFTTGSRGDIQPYVALGPGLQAAGHEVVVATDEPFRAFVTKHGLTFRPITGNVQQALQSEDVRRALWVTNPVAFLRDLRRLGERIRAEDGIGAAVAACERHVDGAGRQGGRAQRFQKEAR